MNPVKQLINTMHHFFAHKGARDTAQLTRRQVQRSADNTLEEFVHLSISSIERKKGVNSDDYISTY